MTIYFNKIGFFLFKKRNKLDLKIVYFLDFKILLSLAQWQKLTFAKFYILFPSRKLVTKITKKVFAKTNLVKGTLMQNLKSSYMF